LRWAIVGFSDCCVEGRRRCPGGRRQRPIYSSARWHETSGYRYRVSVQMFPRLIGVAVAARQYTQTKTTTRLPRFSRAALLCRS